jgi:diacylglycerol kinase (ATP)
MFPAFLLLAAYVVHRSAPATKKPVAFAATSCPCLRNIEDEDTGMGHIRHFFAAFRCSLQGIAAAFRSEIAFRQEIVVLVAVAFVSFALFPPVAAMGLIAAWLFVTAVELLNMAVENVCNLVSEEIHPLIKKAKDAGSAAVFTADIANGILWIAALLLL